MDDSRNYPLTRFAVVLLKGWPAFCAALGAGGTMLYRWLISRVCAPKSILLSRQILDRCDVGLSVDRVQQALGVAPDRSAVNTFPDGRIVTRQQYLDSNHRQQYPQRVGLW
jgi:hypothetical protein